MLKKALVAALAVGTLAIGGLAHAGSKNTTNVTVNTVSRWANGSMGSARNSADTLQYIGCYLQHPGGAGPAFVLCGARDSVGTAGGCTTSDPAKVEVVKAITSTSYVYFNWDAGGTCGAIIVEAKSSHPPLVL